MTGKGVTGRVLLGFSHYDLATGLVILGWCYWDEWSQRKGRYQMKGNEK